jgi:apolipoprotein N-acyltransferase
MTLTPAAAAGVGYLAGLVFFSLNFAWFGETAGALLGPFGPLLDLGPSVVEALAFALAGWFAALAASRLRGPWVPIVAAAGFTVAEELRSVGLLGVPLYHLGAAFVDSPLAPIAAFGGVYAVTFAVALLGAALGALAIAPSRRRAAANAALIGLGVTAAAVAAWFAWPARLVAPATLRVAAVQGNIRQSVKWEARSLPTAVQRYTALTLTLGAVRPQFVLWPETVITTDLRLDPGLRAATANADIVAQDRLLEAKFSALARSLGAVIAVGSDEATVTKAYNDLFFFDPAGGTPRTYRKRQLVPFAEFLPGPSWLRALPFGSLVSDFGAGRDPGPFDARLRVAPLICWEAGFGDLAQAQAARGARFFAIATDDAWFGDSDGPYAQAQIAQLRAIETGRWIVRAAATGISGIIAPDGRWRERSRLDTEAVVSGKIGAPQPTFYSRFGPVPAGAVLALIAAIGFAFGPRRVR